MNYSPNAPETLIMNVPVLKLILQKLPRHWKMSILHISNVTDSWWKKSHWATSNICLCHSISSTAAFSQMMRKLLSQFQHPLFFFFPSPSYSDGGPAQPQPFLSRMTHKCPFEGPREKCPRRSLQSRPDIAIARPGPAVQRPRLPGSGMWECRGKPSCSPRSSSAAGSASR